MLNKSILVMYFVFRISLVGYAFTEIYVLKSLINLVFYKFHVLIRYYNESI